MTPQKTAPSPIEIEFYFDFLSPYSYFAWINHQKIRLEVPVVWNYRPVLMGKLFERWGITGPGEIAPKRYLMLKNCFAYAARMNIEFRPPSQHPFNPLYALRLATSSCSQDLQPKVIEALWSYIWDSGQVADNPEELEAYLADRSLPAAKLMESAFSREAKNELKLNTQAAIERKLFGVPSFYIPSRAESFWGNETLPDLENYLNGSELFDRELFRSRTSDIKW